MGLSGGTYTRTDGTRTGANVCVQQKTNSVKPSATLFDNMFNDMKDALDKAFYRDGQAAATANWDLGGYNITNVAAVTATGTVQAEQLTSTDDANITGATTTGTLTSGEATFSAGATVADAPSAATDVVRYTDIGSATVGAPAYICVQTTADSSVFSGVEKNIFDEDNYAAYSSDTVTSGTNITYASSTGRFTVANAGIYLILCNFFVDGDNSAATAIGRIYISGGLQQYTGPLQAPISVGGSIIGVHSLSASAYIIGAIYESGGTQDIAAKAGCSMTIVRLR